MQVGSAKTDITAYKEGVAMLGYGQPANIMKSIETKLYARTFIFKNSQNHKVAFVNCELCFITQSIKSGVLQLLTDKNPELNYTDSNLVLNAQHTHSGPSGYSHYGLYNAAAPGFVREIYTELVAKISDSIIAAEQNFEEASLSLGRDQFAPEKEVGFQRSIKAYLQNPEAKKIDKNTLHLGINREMVLLKIASKTGKEIGAINWFGTHTTSLPNNNTKLSADNKGYAAQYFEAEKHNGFIAAFAQASCGDVSPKFKYNPKLHWQRGFWEGKFTDDTKSAAYNGQLQYKKASEIYHHKIDKKISSEAIESGIQYIDFGNIQVNPKFSNGVQNARTSPAAMGVSFFHGSQIDGPGMPKPLYYGGKILARLVKLIEYTRAPFMPKEWRITMLQKYYAQTKKDIIIESGARKILGAYNVSKLIIPGWADETVHALKEFHRKGAFDKHPWTQQVLPLQIVKIGSLALACFPFEITTIAAQRLKKTIEDVLLGNGYDEVILCPYSNAYAAYITTYEEYQVQEYEGGHTVFGEYSLAALQTEMEKLAVEMLKPKAERNLNQDTVPRQFTEDDLEGFKYYKNNVYKKYLKQKAKQA